MDWSSPPGNTIQTIIDERKLSVVKLANQLELSLYELQLLLEGRKAINDDLAGKLSSLLGSSKNFWIEREKQYREDLKKLNLND